MYAAFVTVAVVAFAGLVLGRFTWRAKAGRPFIVASVLLKLGVAAWALWFWLYYIVWELSAEVWQAPESLSKLYQVGMPILLIAIVFDVVAAMLWQTKRTFG